VFSERVYRLTKVSDHWYHDTIPVWAHDGWAGCRQLRLAGRLLLHVLCGIGNGGDYGEFAEQVYLRCVKAD